MLADIMKKLRVVIIILIKGAWGPTVQNKQFNMNIMFQYSYDPSFAVLNDQSSLPAKRVQLGEMMDVRQAVKE